jgi:hypothetical protein
MGITQEQFCGLMALLSGYWFQRGVQYGGCLYCWGTAGVTSMWYDAQACSRPPHGGVELHSGTSKCDRRSTLGHNFRSARDADCGHLGLQLPNAKANFSRTCCAGSVFASQQSTCDLCWLAAIRLIRKTKPSLLPARCLCPILNPPSATSAGTSI